MNSDWKRALGHLTNKEIKKLADSNCSRCDGIGRAFYVFKGGGVQQYGYRPCDCTFEPFKQQQEVGNE